MKNALLATTAATPLPTSGPTTVHESGAFVSYTVTQTGTYTITADGAQGGSSTRFHASTIAGGLGAEVSGTFALTAGETIRIAVGQVGGNTHQTSAGQTTNSYGGGGGGGGTWVELINGSQTTILEVAGGGGGSSNGAGTSDYAGGGASTGDAGDGSGGKVVHAGGYPGGAGGGATGNGGYGYYSNVGPSYGKAGKGLTTGLSGGAAGTGFASSGVSGKGGFGGGGGGSAYHNGTAEAGAGGGFTGGNVGSFGGPVVTQALGGSSYIGGTGTTGTSETAGITTTDGNGLVLITEQACFASGTRIETDRGPVAVEHLREGDFVRLAREDAFVPVVWIGHRTVDLACHPRPDAVMPVRVCPNAFGPGLPARDLILSPDHAVFVDDVLIPVRHLLNGATILRERRPSVTYWHIELDRHDVLLAEGLACESYLDTGNRAAFANAGPVISAHPQFDPVFAMDVWATQACAPLVTSGNSRDAVHDLSLAIAADLGHEITTDPAITLLVDGRVLRPTPVAGLLRFELPEGARDIRLTSRRFVPAELFSGRDDRRVLGAAISEIWVDGLLIEMTELDQADGWFAPETEALAEWRWTDGSTGLHFVGARVIDIETLPAGYYWTSPAIVGAEFSRAA